MNSLSDSFIVKISHKNFFYYFEGIKELVVILVAVLVLLAAVIVEVVAFITLMLHFTRSRATFLSL